MNQFAKVYHDLLKDLLNDGIDEINRRTGAQIKVMVGGASFKLDLSDWLLPTCGLRKTWPHVSAAELVWCLSGSDNTMWLRRHTKTWDQFTDHADYCVKYRDIFPEDCICYAKWHIGSAYGYRWRERFGRDQLQLAINALKADPTDRRIWISSWDPGRDGLGAKDQKTVPCPIGFTFSIVNNKLYSTFVLRSSDVFMGLPYDVMRHSMLMAVVATELGVDLGVMQVTLAHPHLYEAHWDLAAECLKQWVVSPEITLPHSTIHDVSCAPDAFVHVLKGICAVREWPTYSPKVAVIS